MGRYRLNNRMVAVLAGLGAALALAAARPVLATPVPPVPPPAPDEPPFGLPFSQPPGASTWHVSQWYGNTEVAYRWREQWYDAGQGLHFGVDFSAPCGTEVVAVGDGIVAAADARRYGSGPYNVIIDHQNGFASLYGHLLEPSPLQVGQPVRRGDFVGLTGDPDLTCDSRPHLHLEIRNNTLHYAYNPVQFIDADWDALALFGPPPTAFQRDLDNPQRWVTPYDQPPVDFWSPLLNNYAHPWPPDWSR